MKRRIRAAILPLLFIAITGYFVFNAVNGSRGIKAQRHNQAMLVQDQTTLNAVRVTRDRWQARVDALRHHAIAGDMLDQQARSVLDLANPDDLAVPLRQTAPPGVTQNPSARNSPPQAP